jgi:chromosomal replication initiation ATPase DnaA
VDDADAAVDEPALLHLLNAAAESGQPVLLTANTPPARQNFALADLASRLRGSLAVAIGAPDDAMLAALMARLAAARQMPLDFRVQNFLLSRLPRSPAAYREAILRLDRTALASGAKISRTLAANVLADLTAPEQPEENLLHTRHFRESEGLL